MKEVKCFWGKVIEMEEGQRRFSLHIFGVPERKDPSQGTKQIFKTVFKETFQSKRKLNNHIK